MSTLTLAPVAEDLLLKMLEEDLPKAVIARITSMSEEEISRFEKERISEELRAQIVDGWRDFFTPDQIAVRLGLSTARVTRELKKLCLID